MASEYWTDDTNENSLSQTDGGLRRCTLGGSLFLAAQES